MAIETDDYSRNLTIPKPNTAILVSDGEEVWVGFALRDRCDGYCTSFVLPPADELSLLYVPAKNFLVRRDDRLTSAGAITAIRCPDNVGCARGNYTKGFSVLVFAEELLVKCGEIEPKFA